MVTFQEKMEHLSQVTIIYVVQFIYSNYLPREDQLTDGGTSSQNVPYLYYGNTEKETFKSSRNVQFWMIEKGFKIQYQSFEFQTFPN